MTGLEYTVLATQGTSPGIIGELLVNIMSGRVEGLPGPANARKVVLLATGHELVRLAASVAAAIAKCCAGVENVEVRAINAPDVVDRASFSAFTELVYQALQGVEGSVVLDVTGGRVGMALAAFIAAYETVGRGRLYITTTQVPPEKYQELQGVFREKREELRAIAEKVNREGCVVSGDEKELLCSLVTGDAVSSVLWPPD